MRSDAVLERFYEESGGHVVMDTTMKIIDVGPQFRRMTHTTKEEMLGKLLTDVLTDPDSARNYKVSTAIRNSVNMAIDTKQVDKMDVFRCDIRTEDGSVKERWWQVANIPILDEHGDVEYVVQRAEDATTTMTMAAQIKAIRRSNYFLYGMVVFLVGIAGIGYSHITDKIAAQSKESCEIQATFIPGQRALASVVSDVNKLFSLPLQPGATQPSAEYTAIVTGMHDDLNTYLASVSKIPPTRSC
jgi:PAS domain S-box-containing protein